MKVATLGFFLFFSIFSAIAYAGCPSSEEERIAAETAFRSRSYPRAKPLFLAIRECYLKRATDGKLSTDEVENVAFLYGHSVKSQDLSDNARVVNRLAKTSVQEDARKRVAGADAALGWIALKDSDQATALQYYIEADKYNPGQPEIMQNKAAIENAIKAKRLAKMEYHD